MNVAGKLALGYLTGMAGTLAALEYWREPAHGSYDISGVFHLAAAAVWPMLVIGKIRDVLRL